MRDPHRCSSSLGSERSGGARIMQKTSLLDSQWRGEVGPSPDIFVLHNVLGRGLGHENSHRIGTMFVSKIECPAARDGRIDA